MYHRTLDCKQRLCSDRVLRLLQARMLYNLIWQHWQHASSESATLLAGRSWVAGPSKLLWQNAKYGSGIKGYQARTPAQSAAILRPQRDASQLQRAALAL